MAQEDAIQPADEALVVNFDETDPWLSRLYVGDAHSGFEYPLTPSTLPPLLDQLTSVAEAQKLPSQWTGSPAETPPAKNKSAAGRAVGTAAKWTAGAAKTVSGKKAVDKAMDNPLGRRIIFGVSAVLALIIAVVWFFF